MGTVSASARIAVSSAAMTTARAEPLPAMSGARKVGG
jgi:hypothetical protein